MAQTAKETSAGPINVWTASRVESRRLIDPRDLKLSGAKGFGSEVRKSHCQAIS